MSGKKKGNIANPDLHSSESPAKDGNELKNRINETAKYSELFEKIDVDSDYDDILATYEKTLDKRTRAAMKKAGGVADEEESVDENVMIEADEIVSDADSAAQVGDVAPFEPSQVEAGHTAFAREQLHFGVQRFEQGAFPAPDAAEQINEFARRDAQIHIGQHHLAPLEQFGFGRAAERIVRMINSRVFQSYNVFFTHRAALWNYFPKIVKIFVPESSRSEKNTSGGPRSGFGEAFADVFV